MTYRLSHLLGVYVVLEIKDSDWVIRPHGTSAIQYYMPYPLPKTEVTVLKKCGGITGVLKVDHYRSLYVIIGPRSEELAYITLEAQTTSVDPMLFVMHPQLLEPGYSVNKRD